MPRLVAGAHFRGTTSLLCLLFPDWSWNVHVLIAEQFHFAFHRYDHLLSSNSISQTISDFFGQKMFQQYFFKYFFFNELDTVQITTSPLLRGVLGLLKFYWAPDIVKFVLGRFSHFNIAIAYSNSTFCGAWTPSFCEFTQIFSKTSTPPIPPCPSSLPLKQSPS